MNGLIFNGIPDYFSFEEIRAGKHYDQSAVNEISSQQVVDSNDEDSKNNTDEIISPIVINYNNDASPTIHTKLAEKDVLDFCNEPLGDDDSPSLGSKSTGFDRFVGPKMAVFMDEKSSHDSSLQQQMQSLKLQEKSIFTDENHYSPVALKKENNNPSVDDNDRMFSAVELGSPCIFSPSFRRSSTSHQPQQKVDEVDWTNPNELIANVSRIQKVLCQNSVFHPFSRSFGLKETITMPLEVLFDNNNLKVKLVKKQLDESGDTYLAITLNEEQRRKVTVKASVE